MTHRFARLIHVRVLACGAFFLAVSMSLSSVAETPKVATSKIPMLTVYDAFKSLQPYILEEKKFEAPGNKAVILERLHALTKGLHNFDAMSAAYREKAGLEANLKILQASLADATRSFDKGQADWALWRLRAVSNRCITCHVTYGVNISFSDPTVKFTTKDHFVRGEFYLASRQFHEAVKEFYLAAVTPSSEYARMEALRKWLIVYTRVDPDPAQALPELESISSKTDLLPADKIEIKEWMTSLERWKNEKPREGSSFESARALLQPVAKAKDPLFAKIDTVELLRGTALLHKSLDQPGLLKPEERSEALYLLGVAYAKLPMFFINELPEIYLEQTIREYPKTTESKRAFHAYKEIVTQSYSGSGGTHIPPEVTAKFNDLKKVSEGA